MRRGPAIRRAGLAAVCAAPPSRPPARAGGPILRAARLGRILTAAVTDRFIGVTGGSGSAADGGGDANRTRGLSAGGFDRRWRSILCQKNFR